MTIKGTKEEETHENKRGYFRQERSFDEFQRVIALPAHMIDASRSVAKLEKGVLTINMPRVAGIHLNEHELEIKSAA